MKRSKLPFGALIVAVALLLTTVGAVYAVWADLLTITGTVATGTVDAQFANVATRENETTTQVATCSASLSDNGNQLDITVNAAYEGYECFTDFVVASAGTIPIAVGAPIPGIGNDYWVTVENCYADGTIVPPGPAACTIKVAFVEEDLVPEGSEFFFSFTIPAQQYNLP